MPGTACSIWANPVGGFPLKTIIVVLVMAALVFPGVAQAHTEEELEAWKAEWVAQVEVFGLTRQLVAEWNDMAERNWRRPKPHVHQLRRVYRPGVEQWRPLVEKYFQPDDVAWAMRVMACESGGDPYAKNPRSSASGLFQHLARYWDARSAKAGWAGASIWDPEANIAVAAWLYYTGGPGHWVCK